MGMKEAAPSAEHILIVDDDKEIRHLLQGFLEKERFKVTAVSDGTTMWPVLDEAKISLIVLDLMLPGDDGLVLCRKIREKSDIPILMLTAKGEDMDRIAGLEMGADDYLPKPFNPRELLARIRVILKRAKPLSEGEIEARYIRFAGWRLDVLSRQINSPKGVAVQLSGSEYRLLMTFITHANRVLSREQLMDLSQGREIFPYDRSIDVQVSRLRQRLKDDAREPAIIKTVRGEGYILAAHVDFER